MEPLPRILAYLLENRDRFDRAEFAFLLGPSDGLHAYRDWLAERDDPRADVLSMELHWRAGPSQPRPDALLAAIAEVDQTWWQWITSDRLLNCGAARQSRPKVRFRTRCDWRWAELSPSGEPGRRDCAQCERAVYWCPTVEDAERHARAGDCIAVHAALVTAGGDPHAHVLGQPDYLAMWATRIFGGA